ncbi:MAG TPA: hypothetical protein VK804_25330 [Bradyrhizobium sp.]|jgi:hypothetical protein|uniref:hypothetical protein n=1 Tax=Bradyrhizobium sp. TaxID=376 RepID=UPI002D0CB492|nr:hypothetical protein [Bradyrhizobium sp.]HTB03807.1 hypothetical protein [Bradyrhizobium sp.]
MSHWGFWDWVTYGCLGIAAFGLAAGAVVKDNPAMLENFPTFFSSAKWAYVPIVLFAIGSAILAIRAIAPLVTHGSKETAADDTATLLPAIPTSLTIRFVDPNNAIHISGENIKRWYFLQNRMNVQSIDPKKPTLPPKIDTRVIWNLVIVFDKLSGIKQLKVSGGPDLPQYQINVFDPIYAVIVFNGEMTGKTVTIEALI